MINFVKLMCNVKLMCKWGAILMSPFFLSACVTNQLSDDIRGHEKGYTHYNDDIIVGVSLAKQGDNKTGHLSVRISIMCCHREPTSS